MGIFETLTEGIRYIVDPSVVKKIQEPLDKDELYKKAKETTEFGGLSEEDSLDVDQFSSANYYTVFQLDRPDDKTINDLIIKYRRLSQISYVHRAINEIVSESIFRDQLSENPVSVDFNDPNDVLSDKIKEKIKKEFNVILDIIDFDDRGEDYFRQWYVDGRLLMQIVLDKKNIQKGILKCKVMSPLYLKRNYDPRDKIYYYTYDKDKIKMEDGKDAISIIPDELVLFVPSGLYESERKIPISYIHPAMKDINRLDVLEDHWLIYRIVRAPERRIFYIDPGNLPPKKAKELLNNVINKYKQSKIYDASTGQLRSKTDHPSILEDFFLLRRNGKGTEIDTLPGGGQGLGDVEELKYFQQKAAEAMHVPYSRLNTEDRQNTPSVSFTGNEITREELQFSKFINKLRSKFNDLFFKLLEKQLVYKNIIDGKEWKNYKRKIKFVYQSDSQFAQAKRLQSLEQKLAILRDAEEYEGKYLSRRDIHRQIFGRTDEEIRELEQRLETEKNKYQVKGEDDLDDLGRSGMM